MSLRRKLRSFLLNKDYSSTGAKMPSEWRLESKPLWL
jgi:hypothetical protein